VSGRFPVGKATKKGDLEIAARAGALCVLVREEDWEPHRDEVISGCRILGASSMEEPFKAGLSPFPHPKLLGAVGSVLKDCPGVVFDPFRIQS